LYEKPFGGGKNSQRPIENISIRAKKNVQTGTRLFTRSLISTPDGGGNVGKKLPKKQKNEGAGSGKNRKRGRDLPGLHY